MNTLQSTICACKRLAQPSPITPSDLCLPLVEIIRSEEYWLGQLEKSLIRRRSNRAWALNCIKQARYYRRLYAVIVKGGAS